jgi:hypothetical protein
MSRHFILAAAVAIVGFTNLAWGDCPKRNPIDGEWLAESDFEKSPGGEIMPSLPCYRNYVCVSWNEAHGQQTMGDASCKRIYNNPPAKRRVRGVCSAGGGAADSCNECLTNPPDDQCQYHYEQD